MVALITRDGQVSACAVEAAKRLAARQMARMDLFIDDSVVVGRKYCKNRSGLRHEANRGAPGSRRHPSSLPGLAPIRRVLPPYRDRWSRRRNQAVVIALS
jgi:hypothetical protein